jgi:RND superfamily putative drug exporter
MRRFATWTTGHRKTVIISWIVALIGVGMIAGSAGSDFSEEFKLPASDSQQAFNLLETKFPAQSGDTARRRQGSNRPLSRRRWKRSSRRSKRSPT